MGSQTKDAICYICGTFDSSARVASIQIEYQEQRSPHFSFSLSPVDLHFIVYQSLSTKSKPIQLFSIEFPDPSTLIQDIDTFVRPLTVNHFEQQLTICSVFKLNSSLVCLFGCDWFRHEKVSVMIVYNIHENYTRNYLNLEGSVI
jgi:hypothetical protein